MNVDTFSYMQVQVSTTNGIQTHLGATRVN